MKQATKKKQDTQTKNMVLRMELSLFSELEKIAEREDRSIHGQIIHSIRENINSKQANKK